MEKRTNALDNEVGPILHNHRNYAKLRTVVKDHDNFTSQFLQFRPSLVISPA